MKTYFKHYIFSGSYYEAGFQHGETLRDDIQVHLKMILDLAGKKSNLSRERTLEITKVYAPYVEKYAPGFMEELRGLADGAKISLEEALLLQMKQEVVYYGQFHKAPEEPECTAFAFDRTYTGDGKVYSGQNTDQDGNFTEIGCVVTFAIIGKPKIMMVIPAGQISFLGMNEYGVSIACNFIPCTGWQVGFPRYLMSRLALEQPTFEEACRKLESIDRRASSRNFLIADENGNMRDYEVLPVAVGRLEGEGMLVHANHFLHPDMQQYEKNDRYGLENSTVRQKRLEQLGMKHKGQIDETMVKSFLRDHGDHPCYSLCMHPSLRNSYRTMASMIFELSDKKMAVAAGNPCQSEYYIYEF